MQTNDWLSQGESIIYEGKANMQYNVKGINLPHNKGGCLILTNKNLVFQAHAFNLGSKLDKIPLENIANVDKGFNPLVPTPNMIKVETRRTRRRLRTLSVMHAQKTRLRTIYGDEKMYEVKKRFEISAAHKLDLDYDSKCTNFHGHNWIIDVYLQSETLDKNGMVLDFTHIKRKIQDKFDHKVINEVVPFNPTAENLAKYICDELAPFCYRVDVQESQDNIASYIKDDVKIKLL